MPDIDPWSPITISPFGETPSEEPKKQIDPWSIPVTDPRQEVYETPELKEQAVLDYNRKMLKHRRTATQKYLEYHAGKEIDTKRGGAFLDRVSASFEDDPDDIVTKLQKKYPQSYVQRMELPEDLGGGTRIIIDPDPSNPYLAAYTLEDDGITWNDAADLVGPAIPAATSILTSLIGGGSGVIFNAAKYGLGYLGGKLTAEETNRQLFGGTQPYIGDENQEGILAEALKEAGIETGLDLAFGGAANIINKVMRKGRFAQAEDVVRALDAVEDLQRQGVDVPPLMLDQLFADNPALKAAANQARSTTPDLVIKGRKQHADATAALQGTLTIPQEQLRINIHQRAHNVYTAKYDDLLTSTTRGKQLVPPKEGGEALQQGIKSWDTKAYQEVKDSYTKVDKLAEAEKPIFDLTNAQNTTKEITEGIVGIGKPVREELPIKGPKGETLYKYTTPDIKADDTPEGKLGEIMSRFMKLDTTQDNYEVLKTIRTDAGRLIKQWPWEKSDNIGAAKRFYAVLTDSMLKPTNGAAGYAGAMADATGKARGYYDLVAKANFKKALTSENPIHLQKYFANPDNMTDDLIDTILKQPHSQVFKESIQQSILRSEDPVETLMDWKVGNRDALNKLIAPGKEYDSLRESAIKMKRLKQSDLKKINDDVSFGLSSVEGLLSRKDLTKREVQETLSDFGGYNTPGHELLRQGVFANVIEKSVSSYDDFGNPIVDRRSVNKAVAQLKKSGVWDTILSDTDKKIISGLHSYLNLIKGANDVGVSLQRAGTVADLKNIFNPKSTLTAIGDLKANQGLAYILTNEKLARFLTSSESKRAFTGNALMRTNLIADALLEGTEPGTEDNIATNAKRTYRDFTENPVSHDKPSFELERGTGAPATKGSQFNFRFPEMEGLKERGSPNSNKDDTSINIKNRINGVNINKPTPFEPLFEEASSQSGVPKKILKAVAAAESAMGKHTGPSKAGALGVMQIVPKWHPNVDPNDPAQSIPYAASYLKRLHDQFGSWKMALAAYNWGEGNLKNKGFKNAPKETKDYVNKILEG